MVFSGVSMTPSRIINFQSTKDSLPNTIPHLTVLPAHVEHSNVQVTITIQLKLLLCYVQKVARSIHGDLAIPSGHLL